MSIHVVNQHPTPCEKCGNWTVICRCMACWPASGGMTPEDVALIERGIALLLWGAVYRDGGEPGAPLPKQEDFERAGKDLYALAARLRDEQTGWVDAERWLLDRADRIYPDAPEASAEQRSARTALVWSASEWKREHGQPPAAPHARKQGRAPQQRRYTLVCGHDIDDFYSYAQGSDPTVDGCKSCDRLAGRAPVEPEPKEPKP